MRPLLLTIIALLLGGCLSASSGGSPPAEQTAGTIAVEGRVTFVSLEGGFYGIVADDGRRFDPVNLPPAWEKEGLKVRFRGRPQPGRIGFHMWGTAIEIVEPLTPDSP